jgi:uncharacterized membrane protein YphA (DoxX/SURF4 family)
MEEALFLIGRIIAGGFYIFNGANHYMHLKDMSGYAGSKGVPAPALSTMVTGLMLLLGGASVLLGVYPDVGVALLVAFLVPTAFIMHNFWTVEDPQMRAMEQIQFLKDLALAGSVLMFLMIPEPWELALG